MSVTGRATLRTYLVCAGAALIFLPFVVSAALYSREMAARGRENVALRLQARAETAAGQLAQRLHELWLDVEGLSAAELGDPDTLRKELSLVGRLGGRFSWIGVADVEGKVLAASGGLLEGQSVASRPWFRQGLEKAAAMDVHEAQLLARLLPGSGSEPTRFIDLAAPVKSADGLTRGVIGAHVNWTWVQDTLKRLQTPGVDVMLVSRDRRVLFGPPDLRNAELGAGIGSAVQLGAAVARVERWQDGRDYMTATVGDIAFENLPSFGWSLVVRQDFASATRVADELIAGFWRTLGGGLLIGFLTLALFAGWIVRPLRRLSEFAEGLAGDGEAGFPHPETRYDEAARLSAALTRLQARRAL